MPKLATERYQSFRSHWKNVCGVTVDSPNSSDTFEHLIGHYGDGLGEGIEETADVILYLGNDSQMSGVRVVRWDVNGPKLEHHERLESFVAFLYSDVETEKCEMQQWAETMKACLLELAPATAADAELLFRWVNDPTVRYAAFCSELIAWQDHCLWFERRLSDERSMIWIARDNHAALIGQVRVDIAGGEGLVDVSLDRSRRSQGWSTPILLAMINRVSQMKQFEDIQRLRAEILVDNDRSIACFKQAGFELIGEAERYGKHYFIYVYELDAKF